MKKKFKMVDLDCANCAAKMEDAIKKIDGVNDATVSFMMQKLTIDADDARFDRIPVAVPLPRVINESLTSLNLCEIESLSVFDRGNKI